MIPIDLCIKINLQSTVFNVMLLCKQSRMEKEMGNAIGTFYEKTCSPKMCENAAVFQSEPSNNIMYGVKVFLYAYEKIFICWCMFRKA